MGDVKIGFVKLGNLGMSQVIDLVLDEIAARKGIMVRTMGTGAKMGADEAKDTEALIKHWDPDFVVMISPNAGAPGPTAAREIYKDTPTIIVSDGPDKKDGRQALKDAGFGSIILKVDPLIGAKREFLDPTEMASFNADAMKVLSACGPVRMIQEAFDNVIDQVASGKSGKDLELPYILGSPEKCVERGCFENPYAKAKALAALHMANTVAAINFPACFIHKDVEKVSLTAAAGHEMMTAAAILATEAREIEKANDTLFRQPHAGAGNLLTKTKLYDKPA